MLAFFVWRGFRLGLVGQLARLVGVAAGLVVLAFRCDGLLGGWLRHIATSLTPTEARIAAFLAILVFMAVLIEVVAGRLSRLLARIPVLGGLNRFGGVLTGVVLALVVVWLVTAALLVLPGSLVPFSTAVHHSETARLMRTVTPRWGQDLRAYVEHFTAGHLDPALRKELQLLKVR